MERRPLECPFEDDVLAAVRTARWPERADADLQRHVAGCELCRDAIAVAAAFADVEPSCDPLPDAGLVWVRAQLRARAEAARLAERPITIAQAVAFAAIVGVLGALFGAASPWLQAGLHWAGAALTRLDPRAMRLPPGIGEVLTEHAGLALTLALSALVTPIAVYWVTRERGDEL